MLPTSVKNEKFVADRFVARAVDIVASDATKTLLFILDAPIDSNVTDGKRRVEAVSVHVTMSVTTTVEVVILDADKVLTASVDTAE